MSARRVVEKLQNVSVLGTKFKKMSFIMEGEMQKIKLKKCPFCGGEAEIVKTHVYPDEARRVVCTVCHATTNWVLVDHPMLRAGELDESTRYTAEQAEERVAKLWNARAV